MSRAPLLVSEKCLIALLVVVLSISIVMSVLIGLVLPPNFIRPSKRIGESSNEWDTTGASTSTVSTALVPQTPSSTDPLREAEKYMDSGPRYRCGVEVFPHLVSLTIPTYSDEENEGRRYACSGTILSRNWILVGKVLRIVQ